MIKANKGKIDFDGTEAVLVAETMCLLKSFTEHVLIPKWGSKERAKEEMGKMINEVFDKVEE